MASETVENLALKLYDISAVKFGDFITKSGMRTPVYFDLRVIVSYPEVVQTIVDILHELLLKNVKFDHICGVPYAALSMSSVLSVKSGISMLIRRKEAKSYGTKKMIEGHFKKGDKCVIIEDVITTGSSILETVADLNNEGLCAPKALIILDREQEGRRMLEQKNIEVESLFTMTSLCKILHENGKIDTTTLNNIMKYIKENKFEISTYKVPIANNRTKMTWVDRMKITKSEITKRLFHIINSKETNICLAADLTSATEILNLAEEIGSEISVLKIHADIIEDFTQEFIQSLKKIADKSNFLIMEDRKYADIGNTVALQFTKGIYRTATWADLITVHSISGESVLKAISSTTNNHNCGVFLLAEMSSENNLLSPEYTEKTLEIAAKYPELITGIVCQKNHFQNPSWLQLTPGVKLIKGGDDLGQVYNTPQEVVCINGADLAVVGRGILSSKNRKQEASIYKKSLWEAYLKRLEN